jgi:hypothetical protein
VPPRGHQTDFSTFWMLHVVKNEGSSSMLSGPCAVGGTERRGVRAVCLRIEHRPGAGSEGGWTTGDGFV